MILITTNSINDNNNSLYKDYKRDDPCILNANVQLHRVFGFGNGSLSLCLSVRLHGPRRYHDPPLATAGPREAAETQKKQTARTFETFPKQLAITKKSCGESKTYRQWVGLNPVQFTNVLEWATTTHTHTHLLKIYYSLCACVLPRILIRCFFVSLLLHHLATTHRFALLNFTLL